MKIHIAVIVVLETLAIVQSFGDQDSLEGEPRGLYFPPRQGPWEQIEPSAVGWNSEKLEAALEFAGQRNSSSVVVLYRGRILIERHWDLKPNVKLPNGQRNRY